VHAGCQRPALPAKMVRQEVSDGCFVVSRHRETQINANRVDCEREKKGSSKTVEKGRRAAAEPALPPPEREKGWP